MTKIAVCYHDQYCIVNTEADAQEMILAFTQGSLYEDYLWENDASPITPAEFFEWYREDMNRINMYRVNYPNTIHEIFESLYAFALDWTCADDCGYFSVEVID